MKAQRIEELAKLAKLPKYMRDTDGAIEALGRLLAEQIEADAALCDEEANKLKPYTRTWHALRNRAQAIRARGLGE